MQGKENTRVEIQRVEKHAGGRQVIAEPLELPGRSLSEEDCCRKSRRWCWQVGRQRAAGPRKNRLMEGSWNFARGGEGREEGGATP